MWPNCPECPSLWAEVSKRKIDALLLADTLEHHLRHGTRIYVLMSDRGDMPRPESACAHFIAVTCTPRMQRPMSERAPSAGTGLHGSSSHRRRSWPDQVEVDCHLRTTTRTAGRVGDTPFPPPAPPPLITEPRTWRGCTRTSRKKLLRHESRGKTRQPPQ